MAQLIYLADDDQSLLDVFVAFLEGAGYEVCAFPTGDALVEEFGRREPDLIVLDVMMPGTDGLTICKNLRDVSDVPIIILTAKDSEMDYMRGLALGSDDYLAKPFSPSMLVMRIKALLRRVDMGRKVAPATRELRFGDIALAPDAHEASVRGEAIDLTMTEFALLTCLMGGAGKPVSRDRLLSEVWGIDVAVETRVTDETARRVSQKLKAAGSAVSIKAVWGFGYKLDDSSAKTREEGR